MNCREFQHELFEYVEGSLSQDAQAAADAHLAGCAACREAVTTQRQFAQSMSRRLHQATASLQLPPEVGHRVLAAVREQEPPVAERWDGAWFWGRLDLPLAMATCALVLLAGVFLVPRAHETRGSMSQAQAARNLVSVQLSYVVPTYTFRREGAHVVDALTYQTNVVNEIRQLEPARPN
jgi:anti-sigma factor RsiW